MVEKENKSSDPVFQRLDQGAAYPYSFGEYVRRFVWLLLNGLLIRLSPNRAHAWRRFWLRLNGARLGTISSTKARTRILHPWLLSMGDHSILSDGVTVYNLGPVTIGRHTVVSQDVYLCAGTHDYTRRDFPLERRTISIGSGVWIGAGAFIGPGVTIGDNSVVGARAVVMKDVPPGVVVGGNPARVIKPRPMGGVGSSTN